MLLKLPESAVVDKFIAKTKFYERATLSSGGKKSRVQNDFINQIQKITWKFKLAESTIGISETDKVTEIQIFELELKQQIVPKAVLKIIDKAIPYQILYIFTYQSSTAYGITLKDSKKDKNTPQDYYFSDWNKSIEFDFTGINLEKVYEKLIKAFIIQPDSGSNGGITGNDTQPIEFKTLIKNDKQIKKLEKEIEGLNKKIKNEKQFNKKVDLNKIVLDKQAQLLSVKESLKGKES